MRMYPMLRLLNGNERTCEYWHDQTSECLSNTMISSDYRGLKKRITAIRLAQEQIEDGSTPLILPATPALDTNAVLTRSGPVEGEDPPTLSPTTSLTDVEQEGYEQDVELDHDVCLLLPSLA